MGNLVQIVLIPALAPLTLFQILKRGAGHPTPRSAIHSASNTLFWSDSPIQPNSSVMAR